MAKKSQLPPAAPLTGDEIVDVVQGGANRRATAAQVADTSTSLRRRDRLSAPWSVRSKINGRMAIWLNDAGQFCIGTMQNVKAIVEGLQSSSPRRIGSRSPYALALGRDPSGRVALGLSRAGRLIYRGVDVHAALDPQSVLAVQQTLFPGKDFFMPGDSLTELSQGFAELTALFTAAGDPRALTTAGFGGQGIGSILARLGAVPAQITFPVGAIGFPEIPASGTVAVTVTGSPLSYADPTQAKAISGTVQASGGIYGTLTRAAHAAGQPDTYTFTRSVAGAAIPVDAGLAFIPDNLALRRRILIAFWGTNDLIPAARSAADIFADIVKGVNSQPTAERRAIVICPLWDMDSPQSAGAAAIEAQLWDLIRAAYPDRCIRALSVAQRAGNGSGADNADIAAGRAPRSLYAGDGTYGDGTHPLKAGAFYPALAQDIFNIVKRKSW